MAVENAASEPTVQQRLELLSQNALKKLVSTLKVQPRFVTKPDAVAEALAERLGDATHQAILEQKLNADDWAFLARLSLLPHPFRLRALVLPWRQRGLNADDALAKVSRLLSYGVILPYELNWPYYSATQRLGIEPGTLRSNGVYATFTLAPSVAEWAAQRDVAAPTLMPTLPPERVIEAKSTELLRAVFLILAEAERKPIKMTAKGAIYKSEVTRLSAALANLPTSLPKGTKRSPKSASPVGEPPPLLWFTVAALLGADLLVQAPHGLEPGNTSATFLAAPPDEQARRLIEGWLSGRFDEFPRLQSLVGTPATTWGPVWTRPEPWFLDEEVWGPGEEQVQDARALVLRTLTRAAVAHPNGWFRIDELARLVHEENPDLLFDRFDDYTLLAPGNLVGYGRPNANLYPGVARAEAAKGNETLSRDQDWMEVDGAFVREVVAEPMLWLGLVEIGPDEANPDRVRLTPLSRHLFYGAELPKERLAPAASGPPARIQPSFDVVVLDAIANAALVARLDSFAERRSFDRAATYRLTQEGLVRGLDRGLTGPEIIAFLESIGGGPLPQNVDFTLREWIGLYESLTVRQHATVVEADSPAQLEHWLADREIAPLLGRRLGETTVLVTSRNVARLTEVLKQKKIKVKDVDYSKALRHVFEFEEPDRVLVKRAALEPYLTYRLERFAEPVESSAAAGPGKASYRITPESIRAAARAGWKPDDLEEFLGNASAEGISLDFYARLYGWSGTQKPLRYEPLVAVHLPAEPVGWDVLAAIPSIEPLIRLLPTPSLALVSTKDLDALRVELAQRGFDLDEATLSLEDLGVAPTGAVGDASAESLLRTLLRGDRLGELAGLRLLPAFDDEP